tara:strand:+ start:482 stop:1891 length:1410 start_codon:yes stop_codon:yes gene_type:complete
MNYKKIIKSDILETISKIADENNYEIFVVGGYVRDSILGKKVKKDIDILVLGNGIEFANLVALNLKIMIRVFKNFGTAMIKTKGFQIEFVGARKESYNESSRNPKIKKGTLYDDLSRRDFTVNALAIRLNGKEKGELIDNHNGLKDLSNNILKTPKDPIKTFHDDPLRMLRAIRFSSQLNFEIDKNDFECIKDESKRIKIISKERINDELNKILISPKPSVGLNLLDNTGLLKILIPELSSLHGIEEVDGKKHKDNFYHTLQVLDNISENTDNIWLRWVALLHDIGKPKTKRFSKKNGWSFHGHEFVGSKMVTNIFKRLKLPLNETLKYVKKLILLSSRPIVLSLDDTTDSAVRRLIYDAGDDIDDLMILCEADITTKNQFLKDKYLNNFKIVREKIKVVEERDRVRNFQPPITGEEIMNHFNIKPCKEIGQIKNFIKESILNGDIENSYKQAYNLMIEKGRELGFKND